MTDSVLTVQPKKRKHSKPGRPRNQINKMCVICGDVALNLNFGVESCESCKAFFRRNAKRQDQLNCLFDNACQITLTTRRFCSACRLEKCFNSGMDPNLILDDMKKCRRQTKRVPGAPAPEAIEVKKSKCIKTYSENDTHHNSSQSISLLPISAPSMERINDVLDISNSTITSVHSLANPLSGDVNEEDESFYLCKPTELNSIYRPVSREEWSSVKALREAYDKSFCTFRSTDSIPESSNPTLSSLVNSSGFMVRKLVLFAKCLADFTVLEQKCQLALLKGVFLPTLFLRSASHYEPSKDAWITPNGEVSTKILQIVTDDGGNLYEEHMKFCHDFRNLSNEDGNLVSLMQVLCLFNPNRLELKSKQRIWNTHDRFILLLKHYLEAQHGIIRSRELFAAVLTSLADLQRLTNRHGQMLAHLDPSKLDPLIIEVFDLGFFKHIPPI